MHRTVTATLIFTAVLCSTAIGQQPGSQPTAFTVVMDQPQHGIVRVTPALPASGAYADGTVITLTAVPEPGFVVDALYYSVAGQWGPMFHDTPSVATLSVTVDQNMHVGGYFIEASEVKGLVVTEDVVYATPGVKPLKYDVYAPEGANNLPCLVIVHGGGWSSNDEDIMRGLARELARTGKYVVFSIDYRWNGTLDGDESPNTMADLIGDVFGAIAHIQEHAREYGGDPDRIGVTGDSAGGHLSAVAATMTHMIGDGGFGVTPGVFEYLPSYLPRGLTVAQVRTRMMSAVRAAAPSYGVFSFDAPNMRQYLNLPGDEATVRALSPIHNIPNARERAVPHYLTRGTLDPIITDEGVRAYLEALVTAGHPVEYVEIGGASHAFFDWKPEATTEATFRKYGVYYAEEMAHFFDSVFYPGE
jgi:acetyl esterase/lipase